MKKFENPQIDVKKIVAQIPQTILRSLVKTVRDYVTKAVNDPTLSKTVGYGVSSSVILTNEEDRQQIANEFPESEEFVKFCQISKKSKIMAIVQQIEREIKVPRQRQQPKPKPISILDDSVFPKDEVIKNLQREANMENLFFSVPIANEKEIDEILEKGMEHNFISVEQGFIAKSGFGEYAIFIEKQQYLDRISETHKNLR